MRRSIHGPAIKKPNMDIFVTKFHCRAHGNNYVKASAFLHMLSPVWWVKLCSGELFKAALSHTLRFPQALDPECWLEADEGWTCRADSDVPTCRPMAWKRCVQRQKRQYSLGYTRTAAQPPG